MIAFIKLVDKYIGKLLCNVLGIFNIARPELKPENILIIQLWGIGETILTLPAVNALRQKFPKAKIDVLATSRNKDVYFDNKDINKLLIVRLNPFSIAGFVAKNFNKYGIVIDMEEYLNVSSIISFFAGKRRIGYSHGARAKLYTDKVEYNDSQHVSKTFLDLVKILDFSYEFDRLIPLNYSKAEKNHVAKFLKKNHVKKDDFIVCIAPGSAESAKCRMWPQERYAELCDELVIRHKAKIIFIGAINESDLVRSIQGAMDSKDTINSAGKLTLNELFFLVTKARLFVGNDAGPMHVSAAQGVRTIGLFGPNTPQRFGPFGEKNIGIYKGNICEFSPCINVHKGEVTDCLYLKNSNEYQKCMKNINVNDVLKEVEKII